MLVLYTRYIYTRGKLNKMTQGIWDERFAVFNSHSSQRFESPGVAYSRPVTDR